MSDTHDIDIGTPVEGPLASLTPLVETPHSPTTAELGPARALKDVMEVAVVGERKYQLKKETEDEFRRLVQEHFTIFSSPGAAQEAWQTRFIGIFQKQMQSALGTRRFEDLDSDERTQLIAQEAAKFAAENKNVETIIRMAEFDLKAIQEGTFAKIRISDRIDASGHVGTPGLIDIDPALDSFRGATMLRTVAGTAARRVIGRDAIALPRQINKWLDVAGIDRPAITAHMTPGERASYAERVARERQAHTVNKRSPYTVDFATPTLRRVDLSGLGDPQKLLMVSYGLSAGDDYEKRTIIDPKTGETVPMTTYVESRLKALTDARVDFYTKTGMDVARIKVDFRIGIRQAAHTKMERDTITAGMTTEQARIALSDASIDKSARAIIEAIRSNDRVASQRSNEQNLDAQIQGLSGEKSEEDIKTEKERYEAQKKTLNERKKKAEAREKLEKQIEEAQEVVAAAERSYTDDSKGLAEAQADYDQYDIWSKERKGLGEKIARLSAEEAQYERASKILGKLQEELEKLNSNLSESRSTRDASDNIRDQITKKQAEIAKLKGSFVKKDTDGNEVVDAAGNPVSVDFNEGGNFVAGQLVLLRARLEAIKDHPEGWDEQKTLLIKGRRDALAQIVRLQNQLTNGLSSGTLDPEESKSIQEKIDAIDKKIEKVADPDQYANERKEDLETFKQYVDSREARSSRADRLVLMRANELPMEVARFQGNWPRIHLRAIQGVFGDDVLRNPELFTKATRLLSPDMVLRFYNLRRGLALDEAAFAALPMADVDAADIEFIVSELSKSAYKTSDLAFVSIEEKTLRESASMITPDSTTPMISPADIQLFESTIYYYRDTVDLQITILDSLGASLPTPRTAEDFVNSTNAADIDVVKRASLAAREVDKLRKQRLIALYGKPSTSSTPITP